jgi:hypothetical protein
VLYEVASLDVPKSKVWQELDRKEEHTKRMEGVRYESYWLDFVMYAPANNR